MSGAEVLAVVGIVSNILQLTEFAAKVTDRTLEFAGKAAQLPGSFSDLRVVLAVVRLNLRKLQSRVEASRPDKETLDTIKGLVRLIQRDARLVHDYLEKYLPNPDGPKESWAKLSARAFRSVFGEGKIKHSTDSIMQNCELLGQTATASLPTADEIAKAVDERQTSAIDRRLSVIMDRMKNNAVSKTAINKTTFNNQTHEHRHSNTGHAIKVKGQTQINNTYITVQMSYDQLGAQLDQAALSKASLIVPGTDLPFHPLLKSVSNPNISGTMLPRRNSGADAPPTGSGFVIDEGDDHSPSSRSTTPRQDVTRRATTGRSVTPRSQTPQPPVLPPHFQAPPQTSPSYHSSASPPVPLPPSHHSRPSPPIPSPQPPQMPDDDQSEIWDSETVAPSQIYSNVGSSIGLGHDRFPSVRHPPRTSTHSSRPSYSSLHSQSQSPSSYTSRGTHSRTPSSLHDLSSAQNSAFVASPVSPYDLHDLHYSVFELDGSVPPTPATLSPFDTHSSIGTASDVWTETLIGSQSESHNDAATSLSSALTAVEDHSAINTVNAFIRSGARAVTSNPSEAKRAYMSAMNSCKPIVAYSPAFSVRKFRALTLAAVGLSLCTMDRERYLKKARDYNAQAMTAANRTDDVTLVHRVRLDEADLQMKEARMLEKKGAGPDATMRQFTAFGTYQTIAMELGEGGGGASVLDYNTRALALLGCGKMAGILGKNPGTFRTSQGNILAPRAYLEQALESCAKGRVVVGARQDDFALLRDTEAQVQKAMIGSGR